MFANDISMRKFLDIRWQGVKLSPKDYHIWCVVAAYKLYTSRDPLNLHDRPILPIHSPCLGSASGNKRPITPRQPTSHTTGPKCNPDPIGADQGPVLP